MTFEEFSPLNLFGLAEISYSFWLLIAFSAFLMLQLLSSFFLLNMKRLVILKQQQKKTLITKGK